MKIKLFFIFIFFSSLVLGQDVIMEEETEKLYAESNFGANRKHFVHFYTGAGFYLPDKGDGFKYWNTNSFIAGVRYKLKLTDVFSTGLDIHYKKSNFRYDSENQIIPDNQFFDKEQLIVHGVGPSYYLRINFDSDRGNYVGNFVDVGVYMDWIFGSRYKISDASGSNLFKETETIYKNIKRLNDFEYGAMLRMAKNKYVLFIHYRLSDLFDEKYNYVEHPRATLGILVGFHN